MRSEPRRVLLVSPGAKPGGAERAFTSLCRWLPELSFDVHAAVLEDGPLVEWLEEIGCPVSVIESGRLRDPRQACRTVGTIRDLIERWRPQVVISSMDKGHIYGGAAALWTRIPAVWWQHVLPIRSRFARVAAAFPSAAVVCVCDEAVARQRQLTPRRFVTKIVNGVPVAELRTRLGTGSTVRKHLGWERNPIIGTVARLQSSKGQEVFLKAAALISRRYPAARFLIVGGAVLGWEGTYPDDLKQLASRLGLEHVVHFAGHQIDVPPWMDSLDIAVLASFGEGFPLVLLEGMSLGKPVVATAVGGCREIVRDEESGLLVPPGEPQQLADAVCRILADRDLASRLGREAEKRARLFSEERMAEGFAELLSGVIRSGGAELRQPVGAFS